MIRKSLWLFAIVIVSSALSTFSGCSSEESPLPTNLTAEDKAKHNPKPTFKESVETHKKDKED